MKTLLLVSVIMVLLVAVSIGAFLLGQQLPGPIFNISKSATTIDLRGRGLSSLPAEIGEYTEATQLLLDDNNLTGALPAEIRKMRKLEVISARDNQLTAIPAEIGQLQSLKLIDFSSNDISTYPNELFQLQQSLTVDLTGNPFTLEQVNEIRAGMPNASVRF